MMMIRETDWLVRGINIILVITILLQLFEIDQFQVQAAPAKDNSNSAFVETSLHLSSANWSTQISSGSWFIEFYTPYSKSCKELAPTWQELTANKDVLRTGYPDAPFSLAQVDCSAEQELCVREGVKHVPKLSLYRDGIQTESEFTQDREYTELAGFVDAEALAYRKVKGASDVAHPIEDAANSPNLQNKADGQIGPVPQQELIANQAPVAQPAAPAEHKEAAAAAQQPVQQNSEQINPPSNFQIPNPQGKVLQFGIDEAVKDKEAFQHFLSKNANHGATFVKFFAPWCPHCKAMAGAFKKVAEALKGSVSVVEVDCEANHLICKAYKIESFPTLRMYNEGEMTSYRGGRSFEAMKTWALKAGSSSGVRQVSADEIGEIARNVDVFFLYIHGESTPQQEVDAVTKASRILLTTPVHVYRSSDPRLISRYRSKLAQASGPSPYISGLLAFKDGDDITPTANYYPSKESVKGEELSRAIGNWLDSERFPTVVEVTGNTFTEVINNRQNTPVVLAALSDVYHSGRRQGTGTGATMRDEELRSLKNLALAWRRKMEMEETRNTVGKHEDGKEKGQHILFAWIDADRWATAIRKYYGIKPTQVPRLLLADGSRWQYYDLPSRFVDPYTVQRQEWLDIDDIFESLDLIWKGKGGKAKSSRTYLDLGVRETASFIESSLLWVANHPFASICLTMLFIGVLISYLRRQARLATIHSQRLPAYGKVD